MAYYRAHPGAAPPPPPLEPDEAQYGQVDHYNPSAPQPPYQQTSTAYHSPSPRPQQQAMDEPPFLYGGNYDDQGDSDSPFDGHAQHDGHPQQQQPHHYYNDHHQPPYGGPGTPVAVGVGVAPEGDNYQPPHHNLHWVPGGGQQYSDNYDNGVAGSVDIGDLNSGSTSNRLSVPPGGAAPGGLYPSYSGTTFDSTVNPFEQQASQTPFSNNSVPYGQGGAVPSTDNIPLLNTSSISGPRGPFGGGYHHPSGHVSGGFVDPSYLGGGPGAGGPDDDDDDDNTTQVRYGRIPQRIPRRLKTVKQGEWEEGWLLCSVETRTRRHTTRPEFGVRTQPKAYLTLNTLSFATQSHCTEETWCSTYLFRRNCSRDALCGTTRSSRGCGTPPPPATRTTL